MARYVYINSYWCNYHFEKYIDRNRYANKISDKLQQASTHATTIGECSRHHTLKQQLQVLEILTSPFLKLTATLIKC